jgi:hypothetical protein
MWGYPANKSEGAMEIRKDHLKATAAMLVGTVLIVIGDWLLGNPIEIFQGMDTFTLPWALDIFLVPFIAGWVVAKMYGEKGGKWLACVPPLLVRFGAVYYLYLTNPEWNADLSYHMHLHYWGLCVILAVEAANIGGILGEFKLSTYIRNDELRARERQERARRETADDANRAFSTSTGENR